MNPTTTDSLIPLHALCLREIQDHERKFRDQIDTLSARVSELDTENRKLREKKYELDSKVRQVG
jgi:spindle assembly abnormal protein 6